MKIFLASAIGIIVSFSVVFAMEFLAMTIFPAHVKIDRHNIDALKTFMDHVPITALIIVIIGHSLGTLFGAFAAYKVQPNSMVGFLVVFILMIIGTISNFAMIPHPVWFMVADVGIVFLSGMIAWRRLHWT